jgi:hypothetical protein
MQRWGRAIALPHYFLLTEIGQHVLWRRHLAGDSLSAGNKPRARRPRYEAPARVGFSILLQGLKPLFFKLLNVAAKAATHKDHL